MMNPMDRWGTLGTYQRKSGYQNLSVLMITAKSLNYEAKRKYEMFIEDMFSAYLPS